MKFYIFKIQEKMYGYKFKLKKLPNYHKNKEIITNEENLFIK